MSVPTIAQLLQTARLHQQNRARHANRLVGKQHRPDYDKAVKEAQFALDARLEAERRDPDRLDPSWAQEPHHDDLVTFLRAYVA